jgi:hypothetical protein
MILPKLVLAIALAALALPGAAQAAPPWSDPVTVAGSEGQAGGAPRILFTPTRGGAVAFNAAGEGFKRPLLRGVIGPLAATRWDGAPDFDTTFGSFAAGDRLIYAGSNGRQRVNVALAAGPRSDWRVARRGPRTGGARAATAAVPGGRAAAVFSTFRDGDVGAVYLVRQTGVATLGPTQRLSAKGNIRAVSVAVNAAGDVLAAWDRDGTIEARFWYGRSQRLSAVQELGNAESASHVSAALGADRRAVVAWIDQRVVEGTATPARVLAVARSATRGFGGAALLDAYPDDVIAGGAGLEAAYTSDGRGVVAWSGRHAVRAAFVAGRAIGMPRDLAPVAPEAMRSDLGFGDLATSPAGQAVVTMVAPVDATRNQILAAPLAPGAGAFGPAEAVSPPEDGAHWSSAGFAHGSNRLYVAWQATPSRIEVAQRPGP